LSAELTKTHSFRLSKIQINS